MKYYIDNVKTSKDEFYTQWETAVHNQFNPTGAPVDLLKNIQGYYDSIVDTIEKLETVGEFTIDGQTFKKVRETFKTLIDELEISASKLAKLSGVSKTTITSLARGEREFKNLPVENAVKISHALCVRVDDILEILK